MFIGITGLARSGKDTFAELLAEELFEVTRQRYVLMAYAHELKLMVQRDFDLSYEQLWGGEKEVNDGRYVKQGERYLEGDSIVYWTPREILQRYGEFYRTIHYNFWVESLFNVIEDKEYKNVIVTDVRHQNEIDPIIKCGGSIVKIVRGDRPEIHGSGHISEAMMFEPKDIEFTIENNGTLKELRSAAKDMLSVLVKNK